MASNEDEAALASENPKSVPLIIPKPVVVASSSLCSSYFRKLPPLSPRCTKLIEPSYNLPEEFKRKSSAEFSARGSSCSAGSTISSFGSDSLAASNGGESVFNFQRKPSEYLESSTNDIVSCLKIVSWCRVSKGMGVQ